MYRKGIFLASTYIDMRHEEKEERQRRWTVKLDFPTCPRPPWGLSLTGYDANKWERQEGRWVRWEIRVVRGVNRTKQSTRSSFGGVGVRQVKGRMAEARRRVGNTVGRTQHVQRPCGERELNSFEKWKWLEHRCYTYVPS